MGVKITTFVSDVVSTVIVLRVKYDMCLGSSEFTKQLKIFL